MSGAEGDLGDLKTGREEGDLTFKDDGSGM